MTTLLIILIGAGALLQIYDAWSTIKVLKAGGRELNPSIFTLDIWQSAARFNRNMLLSP